jgi:DNA-binding IclR family transcriptional regulator
MEKRTGVDAVVRALDILKAFGQGRSAMTLTELANHTGLYKSTVLRLAASLEGCGFLERGADLVYRPGHELWRLGALYSRRLDIAELVRPILATLVEKTGETASYYVRDGDERVCLYRKNSPRAVRHHLDEGIRLPIHNGAAGRILSAYSEPRTADGDQLRRQRYCVSLGERDPEVGAAAVPIIDASGQIRGALSVSAILARFDEVAQSRALDALELAADPLGKLLPPA